MRLRIPGTGSAFRRQDLKARTAPADARERAGKAHSGLPFDFDLARFLAAAGTRGATVLTLTFLARQVHPEVTEADVAAQLDALLSRGLVAVEDGQWKLK